MRKSQIIREQTQDKTVPTPRDTQKSKRIFVYVRYVLPLVAAVCLLVLGAFHNVFALQTGRPLQVSVLQLWFNTLKAARTYLLGDDITGGVRTFYVFLLICAILAAVLFLISVVMAVFTLCTLHRVARAHKAGNGEAEKESKIMLRAFLPNRFWLFITNLVLLPMALFPELFSFICSRFLTVSGGDTLYVRFNVTALVVGLLVLGALALGLYTRRIERALGLDLFFVDGQEDSRAENETEEEAEEEDGEEEA